MPIVSSEILEDSQQADGRRLITEKHTDSNGVDHKIVYIVNAGVDVSVASRFLARPIVIPKRSSG